MAYKFHTVTVGSTSVDCAAFGKGVKPLVILPGLSVRDVKGAGPALALMYRSFGKKYRVYVFDKPRHVPEGCSIGDIATMTAGAMSELGIRDAHILGVSMGGMIAQKIALEHPELAGKLVLAVTASRPNPSIHKAIETWTYLLRRGAYRAFTKDMFERLYTPACLERYDPLIPIIAPFSKPRDMSRFARLAAACLTVDTFERLSEIRCPALVIGAAEDKVVTAQASVELAEGMGCALHMYANMGHAVHEEAKDFNDVVLNFFEG